MKAHQEKPAGQVWTAGNKQIRSAEPPAWGLLNHSSLAQMQRQAGNEAVAGLVQRAPEKKETGEGTKGKPDEQKLSAMRTIALNAIDVYQTAAEGGIADAVGTVTDPGWKPFGLALAGNLVWAAACFSTGGTAFAISLAGIAIGASGSVPTSEPEFKKWANDNLIAKVVADAKGQVDKVTRDVAGRIPQEGWDDNKLRQAILSSMFRPEYIEMLPGGIPNVNRSAIRHRVDVDVLIQANRQVADPNPMQNPGFVRYTYTVAGHMKAGRWDYGDKLEPFDRWKFSLKEASLVMEKGGSAAVDELKKDKQIEPAKMPFVKLVVLESTGDMGGQVVLVLDGENKFFKRNTVSPVFYNVDGPAALSHLWQASGGLPPPLATTALT